MLDHSKIRHTPIDIFKKSKQHSLRVIFCFSFVWRGERGKVRKRNEEVEEKMFASHNIVVKTMKIVPKV